MVQRTGTFPYRRQMVLLTQILFLFLLIFLSGCSSSIRGDSFLRDNIDLDYVRKIAVLPVVNNSSDLFAPERVRDMTITRILAGRLFDVVDKGVVDGLMREEGIDPVGSLDRQAIRRIGQRLKVQALMLGTVDFASETRRGSVVFPEVTVTLRLLEVESAMIIWQADGHGSGDSLLRRLLGLSCVNSYQTTMDLIDTLLATIPRTQRK